MSLDSTAIPSDPGTYALVLGAPAATRLHIGRLGVLQLRPGRYIYVGSAFGPGGLRARIAHLQRIARRPHWHIDYLRRYARLEGVWYVSGIRFECEWVASPGAMPDAAIVMPRLGSSVCGCAGHLVRIGTRASAGELRRGLGLAATGMKMNTPR